MPNDPQPVTPTDSFLRLILGELRTLNAHFGGGAEPSGPAVADGLTVTEQPPANVEHGDQPEPLAPPPGQSVADRLDCPDCGRDFTSQSGLSRHRQAKHEED